MTAVSRTKLYCKPQVILTTCPSGGESTSTPAGHAWCPLPQSSCPVIFHLSFYPYRVWNLWLGIPRVPRRGRKGKSLREIPRAGGNEARINWAGIMFARQGWHLLGRCLFYLVSFSKFYNYIFHSAPASGWWRLATVFTTSGVWR